MKISTLVENTTISPIYKKKHGLCFHIKTEQHNILFDLGSNGLFIENAKKLKINLEEVDILIISHGHMDHGKGLVHFLKCNEKAKIYIRESAFDPHFSKFLIFKINVGLDNSYKHSSRVIFTSDYFQIDDELLLFSNVQKRRFYSKSNHALYMKQGNKIVLDDFLHEQSLIIQEKGHRVLIAGCSHSGIVNIQDKAEELIQTSLTHVIGGFHLYNPIAKKYEKNELIQDIAKVLKAKTSQYYTCHCTGERAYKMLKSELQQQIGYLSTGSMIEI